MRMAVGLFEPIAAHLILKGRALGIELRLILLRDDGREQQQRGDADTGNQQRAIAQTVADFIGGNTRE